MILWKAKTAEPASLNLRYFSIAIGAAAVHFLSGLDILVGDGSVLATTPLFFMSFLLGSHYAVAAILIFTALMAVVPFLMTKPTHLLFMAMVAPQQMLLLSHFVSVAIALISGHYPDGYVPAGGAYFIFADQAWLLMIVALHTAEYIEAL